MTRTRTLTVVIAGLLLASLVSASAEAQEPPKLPTELWREYPLDPAAGEEPQQSGTPQLTTTAGRPAAPATEPRVPAAQEEGSNLWVVLGITLGLAMLVGILAALVVIGSSVLLARGRSRWRLIRARGALKRARTQRRLSEDDLRSEAGALVPFAERSVRRAAGQRRRPVAVSKHAAAREAAPTEAAPKRAAPERAAAKQGAPERAAAKQGAPKEVASKQAAARAAPKEAAPKQAAPERAARKEQASTLELPRPAVPRQPVPTQPAPTHAVPKTAVPKAAAPKAAAPKETAPKEPIPSSGRTSPGTPPKKLPKKLPKAGAPPPKQVPPPKKELPGFSPPKKAGRVPSKPPSPKALARETRRAPERAVKPKLRAGPVSGKGSGQEPRFAPASAGRQPLPTGPPAEKAQAPEPRADGAKKAARDPRSLQPVPTDAPVRGASHLRAAEEPPVGWERCQVEWWRGYVTCDFYALAVRPDGEPYVAARSPRFRWVRSEPPPQRGRAAEAHARLLEQLADDGWEATQTRGAWYGTRLRRPSQPTLRELSGRRYEVSSAD
jgi:hypothetical protein